MAAIVYKSIILFLIILHQFTFITALPFNHVLVKKPIYNKIIIQEKSLNQCKINSNALIKKSLYDFRFIISAIAGAISCSFTHGLLVPLDVIKTKIQIDSSYANCNVKQIVHKIIKSHGLIALFDGFTATASGYFLQGAFKFGFYDYFKYKLLNNEHIINYNNKYNNNILHLPILFISSGFAEIIASFALCPLEVTKVFIITNNDKYRNHNILNIMNIIVQNDGIFGLFKGIHWIILRQVPYTCVKLAGYDVISDKLRNLLHKYNNSTILTSNHQVIKSSHDDLFSKNHFQETLIQLSSGITAGVLAAIISHPADVIFSRVCGSNGGINAMECLYVNDISSFINIIKSMGFKGCYAGLKPRAMMIGCMTALQFVVYEQVKSKLLNIYNDRHKLLYNDTDDEAEDIAITT